MSDTHGHTHHQSAQTGHGGGPAGGEHHVESLRTYLVIFAWLMILLVLTVAASRLNLGSLNIAVAMLIAVVKAVLVILFFMHVRHGSKLIWIFSGAAFLWLAIMFGLTLNDYTTRDAGWSPAAMRLEPTANRNPALEHTTAFTDYPVSPPKTAVPPAPPTNPSPI